MRVLAHRLLRRGQAHPGPHQPAHPRSRLGRAWPDPLRQPAEHDGFRRLQPRFQQAPDEHARMFRPLASAQRPARAHGDPLQHRVQQARQGGAKLIGQHRQHRQHGGELGGQRLALLRRPEPGGSRRVVGRGQPFPGGNDRRQHVGGPFLRRGQDAKGRLQAEFQPRQQVQRHRIAGVGQLHPQAGQAGRRTRPAQDRQFQGPRGGAAGGGGQAGSGQRMLQQRQQRHRRQLFRHGAGQQPQEHRRGRVRQGFAGAVIGDDAEAGQLRRHPHGQLPVRRDQRRPRARHLQRIAQHQRDRRRLLLLIRRGQPEQAPQVLRWGWRLSRCRRAPFRQRLCRQQRRAEQPGPILRHQRTRRSRPGPNIAGPRAQPVQQPLQPRLRMRLVQRVPHFR